METGYSIPISEYFDYQDLGNSYVILLRVGVFFDICEGSCFVPYAMIYVMVAPIISISSDSSEESVGSHAPQVILFGAIPAIILVIPEVPIVPADPIVAPEVGAVPVVSPAGVLDLVDYSSSSDSDPSEDSLPPAPDLPLVLPFLCSDNSEAESESEPAEQRPVSSSYDTLAPLSEFPLASIVAPPRICRRSPTLIRPGETIPFGRPYRTHLNGPHKLLTARKRVRPIFARRLAWKRVSHHSSDHHSSPDSSSSSLPLDHSLSEHTPPNTTDADSSTPQRFVHRSLARIIHIQGNPLGFIFMRSLYSSSLSSGHLARAFGDFYNSSQIGGEENMEVDTAKAEVVRLEDDEEFEAEASAANTREIDVDPLAIGDSFESSRGGIPDLEDTIYDIVHYMSEVRIDRITEIKTTQRQLETSQLVASGERASLVKRIGSLRIEYLKVRAMLSIERDQIDSLCWHMALSQEEFCQVRRDHDDTRRRLRRLESYVERHLGFRP
ncbi:hypothetical protein Tco_1491124 [Tanacetum coccineum]